MSTFGLLTLFINMTQCEDVIADYLHETDSEAYLVWNERAPNWGLVLTLICFTHGRMGRRFPDGGC